MRIKINHKNYHHREFQEIILFLFSCNATLPVAILIADLSLDVTGGRV